MPLVLTSVPAAAAGTTLDVGAGCASLVAAIHAADAGTDCSGNSASGPFVINVSGTVTLTAPDNAIDGPNGLPDITANITIQGGATITRSSSTPFRLFHVSQGGSLTLNGITLSDGDAQGGNGGNVSGGNGNGGGGGGAGLGGAIFSHQGNVTLINTTLAGSQAKGGNGGTSGGANDAASDGAGGGGMGGNGGAAGFYEGGGGGGTGGDGGYGGNTVSGGGGGGQGLGAHGGAGSCSGVDGTCGGGGGGGTVSPGKDGAAGSAGGNQNGGRGGNGPEPGPYYGGNGGYGGGGGGAGSDCGECWYTGGSGGYNGGGGGSYYGAAGGGGGFGGGGGGGGGVTSSGQFGGGGGYGGFGAGGGGGMYAGGGSAFGGGAGGTGYYPRGGGYGGGGSGNGEYGGNGGAGGGAGMGGAIFMYGGTLNVSGGSFSGNTVAGGAGSAGMYGGSGGGNGAGLGASLFVYSGSDAPAAAVVQGASISPNDIAVYGTLNPGSLLGPAAKLVFTTPPANTTADKTFSVAVQVQDAFGDIETSDSSSVTLSLSGGASGATLSGTATVNAANGVATFSGLQVPKAGNGYVLKATDGSVTVNSIAFNVAPGAATQVAWVQTPGNSTLGSPLDPQPKVAVEDAEGNVVTTDTSSVSLALSGGTSGAALTGTTATSAVSGLASFSGLSVSLAGQAYQLTATDGSLPPVASTPFDVTPSVTGSNSGSGSASTGGITATGTGGGTLTVATYSANPGGTPTFSAPGAYFDVKTALGSTYTGVTVKDCSLGGGNTAFWWNGLAWQEVSGQSYDASTHCATFTVTATSSPSLAQLTGTPFAVGTEPTVALSLIPTPNGAGWNNSTVTAALTGGGGTQSITYSGSGAQTIGSTTATGASATATVTSEGVTTLSAYATDANGFTGPVATQVVHLDLAAPATTASTGTYTFGTWTDQSVAVTLTAADTGGSGVAATYYSLDGGAQQTYTAAFTVGTDGDHTLSYWSVDKAGNIETAHTAHVMVDKTAPTTSAAAGTYTFGTWTGQPVTVTLSALDATPGSGVATTYYSMDGGAQQTYTAPFTVSANGDHTVRYWSVDNAGNAETTHTVQVMVDTAAPTTAATTGAYAPGTWTNQSVTITLIASDTGGSGVASTYYTVDGGAQQTYTAPFTLSTEAAHTVTYWSVDNVGNTEAAQSVQVNIDRTDPTISAATDRPANSNGWFNAPVTVSFTCNDPLSGIASCSGPTTLSSDGQGQVVTGTAVDKAGNSATATVTVNLDQTAPTVTYSVYSGITYTVDQQIDIACTAADTLSGLSSNTCQDIVGPAYSFGLGTHTYSATAIDKAGNSTTTSVSFTVVDNTQSLGNLTTQFTATAPAGTATSLNSKLQAAAAAPDSTSRNNQLNAFVHEVQAQSGKKLTTAQANTLIQLAQALMTP